jgi:hypothetical protein
MAQSPAQGDPDQTDKEARDSTFDFDGFIALFGDSYLQAVTRFRLEEFYEVHGVVAECLDIHGRGSRGMDPRSKFLVLLAWLTSGLPYWRLGLELGIAKTIIAEVVHGTANAIKDAVIAALLPCHNTDRQAYCDVAFPDFPNVYVAVDPRVVQIWKPAADE